MMRGAENIRRAFGLAIGVSIGAVFIWAGWRLTTSLVISLSDVPAPLASAIIVALGGAIGWVTNRVASRLDAAAQAHREKKIEIYSKFTDEVLDLFLTDETRKAMRQAKGLKGSKEPDLVVGLIRFQREILFWGSPRVIRAFLETRKYSQDTTRLGIALNKLFAAMRADIGLSNWGIGSDDLTRLVSRDETLSTPENR